ncbi:MAG: hypothetical protein PHS41_07690 [Victivallaceae bacterium]|nr:hypothetical protein [Victivallaceae bacterium]
MKKTTSDPSSDPVLARLNDMLVAGSAMNVESTHPAVSVALFSAGCFPVFGCGAEKKSVMWVTRHLRSVETRLTIEVPMEAHEIANALFARSEQLPYRMGSCLIGENGPASEGIYLMLGTGMGNLAPVAVHLQFESEGAEQTLVRILAMEKKPLFFSVHHHEEIAELFRSIVSSLADGARAASSGRPEKA